MAEVKARLIITDKDTGKVLLDCTSDGMSMGAYWETGPDVSETHFLEFGGLGNLNYFTKRRPNQHDLEIFPHLKKHNKG